MNCKHQREDDFWKRYVGGTVSQDERRLAETHLQQCDDCLAMYIGAVEEAEVENPMPNELTTDFDERVIGEIHRRAADAAAGTPVRLGAVRKAVAHPLFHYAVAACITFLLMSAGAFERLTEHTDAWKHSWRGDVQVVSLSERWTEQAAAALAILQTKITEGTRDEP